MLSRVAESLYWIGRYLERAENVARLAIVATEFSAEVEGLDEELAQEEWDTLLAACPGTNAARLEYSPAAAYALPYVAALLLDEQNPTSVRHSLERARQNARAVREVLTREIFTHLTSACHELRSLDRRGLRDPTDALESLGTSHAAILTTLGAVTLTLSRDQGFSFLTLGMQIERALRTVLILEAKLPGMELSKKASDLPLHYARWRALLRSVASLENFRRARGGGLDAREVMRFLVLDDAAPRSVRCSLRSIRNALDGLPDAGQVTSPDRSIGRLLAELDYDDERIGALVDPLPFLSHVGQELRGAHEAISRQYFET